MAPERTSCCVVGGGPAGMVLGLLLARAGIDVTVLEKHDDFLRDFRGDTVHASTLTLLDELGLGERFAALPQQRVANLTIEFDDTTIPLADLRRLPGAHKHIALVPQWDLLNLLAEAGEGEPTFTLRTGAEVLDVVRRDGRIAGVRYQDGSGTHELHAELTVACDGRSSTVRRAAGLRPKEKRVPMDVWWFRLPREPDDPRNGLLTFRRGQAVIMLDRGDYFQIAYLIPKGRDTAMRREGIETLREHVRAAQPWLGERVRKIGDWDEVKLLEVTLNRLGRWHRPGLLCIGDAAHAMSPVGGVGINLAVQDAVAAASALAAPLRAGTLGVRDLARIQRRRLVPTLLIQGIQRLIHSGLLGRTLGRPDAAVHAPAVMRLFRGVPWLGTIPGYLVAIGPLPEHAPAFARRPERVVTPTAGADENDDLA